MVVEVGVVPVDVGVDSGERGTLFLAGVGLADLGVEASELFHCLASGVVCRPNFFVVIRHYFVSFLGLNLWGMWRRGYAPEGRQRFHGSRLVWSYMAFTLSMCPT